MSLEISMYGIYSGNCKVPRQRQGIAEERKVILGNEILNEVKKVCKENRSEIEWENAKMLLGVWVVGTAGN